MKPNNPALRNAHFLGTKIRNLRKRNNLTIEDLSSRCIKLDAASAPSVSYLSMIERGKRIPSQAVLNSIAQVFQKQPDWFLDNKQEGGINPVKGAHGGITGMTLEPNFLFATENLQLAIPDLLSQAAVSGREFAHLLIRSHQEYHLNQFPDLERAAEEIGKKQLPLSLEDMFDLCRKFGLTIQWIDQGDEIYNESGVRLHRLMRSYFKPPNTIYINKIMQQHPDRLKFDLAAHIGHRVLHASDGAESYIYAGNTEAINPDLNNPDQSSGQDINAQDILHAWRDFECSFFAGALLCPKVPFRRLLDQHAHEVNIAQALQLTSSVVMRRMTSVSSYPHWHYFDAYPPGKLKAVYRGNGIPIPWGNMRLASDPCQHWAVFRMINAKDKLNSSQLSVLESDHGPRLYACESVNDVDLAGNTHVICAGIDINPAIEAQGMDAESIAHEVMADCKKQDGNANISPTVKKALTSVAKIVNIGWLERSIEKPARLICRRNRTCPRTPACNNQLQ